MKQKITMIIMGLLTLSLSGFTSLTERVPAPKGVPKRTENVNAGIVIPSWNCTPHDVIKQSYDPLDAFMRDAEKGTFMALKTSNFNLNPHKLTFHHKKYGFVTHEAYRIWIRFYQNKQEMMNFVFSPFEITLPKPESEVKAIADKWVAFFDSLGWKRGEDVFRSTKPFGTIPKQGCYPYQVWESDGFEQSINICLNEFVEDKSVPKYFIKIVFDPSPNRIE